MTCPCVTPGVQTVVNYNTPIHLQPAAQCIEVRRGQFPVTEHLCTRILALPANQSLSRNDIEFISTEIHARRRAREEHTRPKNRGSKGRHPKNRMIPSKK
jgi:hypothetical protein